ncbi:MAG: hypothetical protein N3B12_06880 [Armatimonadetes bacterium]|nr:hypothetical protein [Armatimonadota bacterium]
MNRPTAILICCLLICGTAVQPATYKFVPYPSADLQDLPHAY